jgi:hypothetical protein
MDQSAIYPETICEGVVGAGRCLAFGGSARRQIHGMAQNRRGNVLGATMPSARRVQPASLREALRAWFSPYRFFTRKRHPLLTLSITDY